jgi:type IV secretory pathway VirB6-like protein
LCACFDTIRCNYEMRASHGGFIRGMRTRTETRHRTQAEIDHQVRLRERSKLLASAMMIAYFGWVVMIVGLLLTMLSADDLTVAGAVASIGFCVMLWIGPILIWPEYFAR